MSGAAKNDASAPRLLISCVNYAPEILGSAPYTRDLACWFSSNGWDVHVVTTYPYYPEWRRRPGHGRLSYRKETLDGVQVWRCPTWLPQAPTGRGRLLHYTSFALSSLPVMLAHVPWRPTLTLAVAPTLAGTPAAHLAAGLSGGRSWLHIQDYELDVALGLGMLPRGVRGVLRRMERALVRPFDIVTTITPQMMAVAEHNGVEPARLHLLPNWAYLDEVHPLPRASRFRRTLGLHDGEPVVLYTGNLGRKQGVKLIADVAELAQASASPALFVVAGQGSGRADLESAVADKRLRNVRLLPLQASSDFNELLNLADVHLLVQDAHVADLVMPSKLTNMLASGRPVIATAGADTGLGRLVREQDVGVVVPPADAPVLAASIDALLSDAEARHRQGRKARSYAEEHLNRERLLSAFVQQMGQARTEVVEEVLPSWAQ